MEEKGSVPPKSERLCLSVSCSSAGTSSLPPYSQEKVAGADMGRHEVILLAALEHTEGGKGFPLEPGLLLEGRLGTQAGQPRS